LLGRPLKTIHIVGGGSRNQVLNQFVAGCHGAKPYVAGPTEATGAGQPARAGPSVRENSRSLAEARQLIGRSFPLTTVVPQPSSGWDEAYAAFAP